MSRAVPGHPGKVSWAFASGTSGVFQFLGVAVTRGVLLCTVFADVLFRIIYRLHVSPLPASEALRCLHGYVP